MHAAAHGWQGIEVLAAKGGSGISPRTAPLDCKCGTEAVHAEASQGSATIHSSSTDQLLGCRPDGLESLQTQRMLEVGGGELDPLEESARIGGVLEGYASPLDQTLQLLERCHISQIEQLAAAPPGHKMLSLYRWVAAKLTLAGEVGSSIAFKERAASLVRMSSWQLAPGARHAVSAQIFGRHTSQGLEGPRGKGLASSPNEGSAGGQQRHQEAASM